MKDLDVAAKNLSFEARNIFIQTYTATIAQNMAIGRDEAVGLGVEAGVAAVVNFWPAMKAADPAFFQFVQTGLELIQGTEERALHASTNGKSKHN